MEPFDSGADRVSRFLLVPDPGNWLHPPHLDRDMVVMVQMSAGQTAALYDRRPVWVRGRISLSPLRTDSIDALFRLNASAVWGIDAYALRK